MFLFFRKIRLQLRKILKKDINIKNENTTSLMLEFNTTERLLNGRKPPEEINVIDKLKESKVRKSNIFKITKIKNVNVE